MYPRSLFSELVNYEPRGDSVADRDWTNTAVDRTQNLALRKKTKHTTTFLDNPDFASYKAVDGNMNPDAGQFSCAITKGATGGSWWEVNLEAVYQIREVVITSRGDYLCKYRILLESSFFFL